MLRLNPFDEFPDFDKPAVVDTAFSWVRAWREKWEPILSEWGVALDEVQNTDPMSVEATLLRWRWRALHSERILEAVVDYTNEIDDWINPTLAEVAKDLKAILRPPTPKARSA